MENELKGLADQIEAIIYREVQHKTYDDSKYKETYEDCLDFLEHEISNAKGTIADYKEEGLTFNSIEMEGYLRGLITTLNYFKISER